MLRLILGRSGSGKTHRVRERLAEAAQGGYSKVFLLVPEQFSFESERALYHALGPNNSIGVEVVSFTRLANLVFRACGGLAKRYIDDCGRRLLMSVALYEVRDSLAVYHRHYSSAAFIQSMVDAVTEFKNAQVSPEALAEAGERTDNSALEAKTDELALIYGAYEALLGRGYADPLDDLPAANRLLAGCGIFENAAVFVDEFKGFTAVELETLSHIVQAAKDCTIALCADGLEDRHHGMGLFSPVITLANRLTRMALDNGTEVAPPEVLALPRRFYKPELAAVEQGIFDFNQSVYAGECEQVRVFSAAGPYEEMEVCAASIAELARERGYRYRDIVVIARELSSYRTALESVFPRYGLPYFYDMTDSAERAPVAAYALHAVEAAQGFDSDSILSMLKTGLGGLDAFEIARLENYVYLWDIRGRAWCAPFTSHPRGFADETTDADRAQLEQLNDLRERVAGQLAKLSDALRSTTGEGFARAVYAFLCDSGAKERLGEEVAKDHAAGRHNQAQEKGQVWQLLMNVLDTFAAVLGATELAGRRAFELFRLAVSSYDLGSIPQTLDQVLVGSAERVRAFSPKAVLILGANEGVFPLIPQGGGLFTDSERETLIALGLALASAREQKAVEERFIAYKALSAASEYLQVSFSRAGVKGEAMTPSLIVRRLLAMFPALRLSDTSALGEDATIVNTETALHAAARHGGEDSPFTAALCALFEERGELERYRRLVEGARKLHFSVEDAEAAKRLFGESITLSPTGLETYYRCRFSYFLKYGIRLKKREKAKLSPLEAGSLIHYALQELLSRFTIGELNEMSDAALKKEIAGLLEVYLLSHMGGGQDKPARFSYLYTRLSTTVARLIRQLVAEFSQSDFVPDAFELPIQADSEVKPVELVTPTGMRVRVEGKIDRVDIMKRSGKRYVRVVDYKSGQKSFSLSDVYYGLNMQMLLYLFTVCRSERYPDGIPAGVLYMPAQNPVIELGREADPAEVEGEKTKQLRMNGLLLEDPEAVLGMERGGQGIFIPAKVVRVQDDDGNEVDMLDKRSKVASLADMGKLRRHIDKLVEDMAESLRGGRIDAVPVKGGDYAPCQYCEFAHICGHEEGDDTIAVEDIPPGEIFSRMEPETEHMPGRESSEGDH